ncbi:MAG: methyltransferase MtaB domain-containing protein [Chloroflexota bacterium]|jgi:methanol--5-hydroxybenzimidazolylcobamide Co-methyltransferase|nr:methyltransferase MtaB domain-containing protein [Chloroflexota bacterium]MDP6509555.1 methyltransferase MtaB domain-containing protein [Chloroflexota bacterium]MDP6758570.1 methyltransferase MtaB domain-containing protein [Chloroflexota bacterium]
MLTNLAIDRPEDLMFGRTPNPVVTRGGLAIGAGEVFAEVNFTLPTMEIMESTWGQVRDHYRDMTQSVLERMKALRVGGVVIEVEHLPPMTERAEWGAEIVRLLRGELDRAGEWRLTGAIRATPVDARYGNTPPILRKGDLWEKLRDSFAACAEAGADILAIESEGGKEVSDVALVYGDMAGMMLALGVLAPRDSRWLWKEIRGIADGVPGTLAGGDTACAFANTAMQLAGQQLIPESLAAVVRAMSAVRGLAAVEGGAVGPWKDCGYEGIVVKAISGIPISMEGHSATCAHFSPVGNVASAACDLWSNESVQNVRLLSGSAPAAFAESLAYDCRLMNTSLAQGSEATLQQLFVDSDAPHSPQAYVLTPAAAIRIAAAIVAEETDYARTRAAATTAVELIQEALDSGALVPFAEPEARWFDRIAADLAELPVDEGELIEQTRAEYGDLYDAPSYGL